MEIRRFGVGHRRPQGPEGSVGLTGGPIHADEHGLIAELVLGRHGRLVPHSMPCPAWLIVIEGGGWVQVGEERARIAAGEAVLWPAGVVHGLWTEGSELRAFVVEFALARAGAFVVDEAPTEAVPAAAAQSAPRLVGRPGRSPSADARDGEPR